MDVRKQDVDEISVVSGTSDESTSDFNSINDYLYSLPSLLAVDRTTSPQIPFQDLIISDDCHDYDLRKETPSFHFTEHFSRNKLAKGDNQQINIANNLNNLFPLELDLSVAEASGNIDSDKDDLFSRDIHTLFGLNTEINEVNVSDQNIDIRTQNSWTAGRFVEECLSVSGPDKHFNNLNIIQRDTCFNRHGNTENQNNNARQIFTNIDSCCDSTRTFQHNSGDVMLLLDPIGSDMGWKHDNNSKSGTRKMLGMSGGKSSSSNWQKTDFSDFDVSSSYQQNIDISGQGTNTLDVQNTDISVPGTNILDVQNTNISVPGTNILDLQNTDILDLGTNIHVQNTDISDPGTNILDVQNTDISDLGTNILDVQNTDISVTGTTILDVQNTYISNPGSNILDVQNTDISVTGTNILCVQNTDISGQGTNILDVQNTDISVTGTNILGVQNTDICEPGTYVPDVQTIENSELGHSYLGHLRPGRSNAKTSMPINSISSLNVPIDKSSQDQSNNVLVLSEKVINGRDVTCKGEDWDSCSNSSCSTVPPSGPLEHTFLDDLTIQPKIQASSLCCSLPDTEINCKTADTEYRTNITESVPMSPESYTSLSLFTRSAAVRSHENLDKIKVDLLESKCDQNTKYNNDFPSSCLKDIQQNLSQSLEATCPKYAQLNLSRCPEATCTKYAEQNESQSLGTVEGTIVCEENAEPRMLPSDVTTIHQTTITNTDGRHATQTFCTKEVNCKPEHTLDLMPIPHSERLDRIHTPHSERLDDRMHIPYSERLDDRMHIPHSERLDDLMHIPHSERLDDQMNIPHRERLDDRIHIPHSERLDDLMHILHRERLDDLMHIPHRERLDDQMNIPHSERVQKADIILKDNSQQLCSQYVVTSDVIAQHITFDSDGKQQIIDRSPAAGHTRAEQAATLNHNCEPNTRHTNLPESSIHEISTYSKTEVFQHEVTDNKIKLINTRQQKVDSPELHSLYRLVDLYDKMLDKLDNGFTLDGKSQLDKFEHIVSKLKRKQEQDRKKLMSSQSKYEVKEWSNKWKQMTESQAVLLVALEKHELLKQRVLQLQVDAERWKYDVTNQHQPTTESHHTYFHQQTTNSSIDHISLIVRPSVVTEQDIPQVIHQTRATAKCRSTEQNIPQDIHQTRATAKCRSTEQNIPQDIHQTRTTAKCGTEQNIPQVIHQTRATAKCGSTEQDIPQVIHQTRATAKCGSTEQNIPQNIHQTRATAKCGSTEQNIPQVIHQTRATAKCGSTEQKIPQNKHQNRTTTLCASSVPTTKQYEQKFTSKILTMSSENENMKYVNLSHQQDEMEILDDNVNITRVMIETASSSMKTNSLAGVFPDKDDDDNSLVSSVIQNHCGNKQVINCVDSSSSIDCGDWSRSRAPLSDQNNIVLNKKCTSVLGDMITCRTVVVSSEENCRISESESNVETISVEENTQVKRKVLPVNHGQTTTGVTEMKGKVLPLSCGQTTTTVTEMKGKVLPVNHGQTTTGVIEMKGKVLPVNHGQTTTGVTEMKGKVLPLSCGQTTTTVTKMKGKVLPVNHGQTTTTVTEMKGKKLSKMNTNQNVLNIEETKFHPQPTVHVDGYTSQTSIVKIPKTLICNNSNMQNPTSNKVSTWSQNEIDTLPQNQEEYDEECLTESVATTKSNKRGHKTDYFDSCSRKVQIRSVDSPTTSRTLASCSQKKSKYFSILTKTVEDNTYTKRDDLDRQNIALSQIEDLTQKPEQQHVITVPSTTIIQDNDGDNMETIKETKTPVKTSSSSQTENIFSTDSNSQHLTNKTSESSKENVAVDIKTNFNKDTFISPNQAHSNNSFHGNCQSCTQPCTSPSVGTVNNASTTMLKDEIINRYRQLQTKSLTSTDKSSENTTIQSNPLFISSKLGMMNNSNQNLYNVLPNVPSSTVSQSFKPNLSLCNSSLSHRLNLSSLNADTPAIPEKYFAIQNGTSNTICKLLVTTQPQQFMQNSHQLDLNMGNFNQPRQTILEQKPCSPSSTISSSLFPVSSKEIVRRINSKLSAQQSQTILPVNKSLEAIQANKATKCLTFDFKSTGNKNLACESSIAKYSTKHIETNTEPVSVGQTLSSSETFSVPTINTFNVNGASGNLNKVALPGQKKRGRPKNNVVSGSRIKKTKFCQIMPEKVHTENNIELLNTSVALKDTSSMYVANNSVITKTKADNIQELLKLQDTNLKAKDNIDVPLLINSLNRIHLIADNEVTETCHNFSTEFWGEDFASLKISDSFWSIIDSWNLAEYSV